MGSSLIVHVSGLGLGKVLKQVGFGPQFLTDVQSTDSRQTVHYWMKNEQNFESADLRTSLLERVVHTLDSPSVLALTAQNWEKSKKSASNTDCKSQKCSYEV